MRDKLLTIGVLTLLAGCSPAEQTMTASEDIKQPAESLAAPNISPTAAPGVAFNYAYDFRLPARRIAVVQEQHAQACEKLGIARCRITGMRFRVHGEDQIEAELALKLAPEIARAFGKEGIAAVEKADGMVVDTRISGDDVGTGIAASIRDEAELKRRIADLEAERDRPGTKSGARADLTSQIEALRSQIQQGKRGRIEAEEALANTPLTFSYGSGGLFPGLDVSGQLGAAVRSGGQIVVGTLAVLIQLAALLLPLLLLVVAFLVARTLIRSRRPARFARERSEPPAEE